MSTLRVVLDANVWMSGIVFPGSPPSYLIEMASRRFVHAFHSESIVDQVQRHIVKFDASGAAQARALLAMRQYSTLVEPEITISVIAHKDSDNRILECAVAANADMIVSGDKRHLLSIGSYEGIPILTPRDAYERILAAREEQ